MIDALGGRLATVPSQGAGLDRPDQSSLPADENRRAGGRRVPLLRFAWYRTLPPAPPLEGLARSCDVSLTGACIYVTASLPAGTRIFLELVSPELSLSAIAEVIWSAAAEEEQLRVGMRFEVLPPNDRVALIRFCGHEQP